MVLHEPRESLGASVWHKAPSPSARADGSLRRVTVRADQPLASLNGPHDRRLLVDAVALALCTPATKRPPPSTGYGDPIASRSGLTMPARNVWRHRKRRFVAGHAPLLLKLERRLAGCLGRHKVRTPNHTDGG